MLVYFLIGPSWAGLLFYWLLIIAPLDERGLPRTPSVSKRRDAPYRSSRAGAGLKSRQVPCGRQFRGSSGFAAGYERRLNGAFRWGSTWETYDGLEMQSRVHIRCFPQKRHHDHRVTHRTTLSR